MHWVLHRGCVDSTPQQLTDLVFERPNRQPYQDKPSDWDNANTIASGQPLFSEEMQQGCTPLQRSLGEPWPLETQIHSLSARKPLTS